MHPFELALAVPADELALELRGHQPVPWAAFWLNPRRLRGSDFLMRWSQGRWSEERLLQAINDSAGLFAIPYGPSSAAPRDDVRAFELYFERLEAAGLGTTKRPDLLVFEKRQENDVQALLATLGGSGELPFIDEQADGMAELLSRALTALECENSL